ncbi:hypothetical protein DERP_011655 [Dermatophagoides pteronyssinus]|uniref:Uncharacterized protein n=1 Tax=Dermatophagoides pteronyssinus TaxID=6956 RepID=A0ABQ8JXJ9_DERPT|nr:hypothetical protein DERP_011655 [Dermatophagoides pteronyssinus]
MLSKTNTEIECFDKSIVSIIDSFVHQIIKLTSLQKYGILIAKFNLEMPAKLIFIIGDNLSVAELLGFKQTFGPNFVCRYCKENLQ